MIYSALKIAGSLAIIVGLTFTQWFWAPVDTPIGVLILLAIFPPTILINVGLALTAKATDIPKEDFKRGGDK